MSSARVKWFAVGCTLTSMLAVLGICGCLGCGMAPKCEPAEKRTGRSSSGAGDQTEAAGRAMVRGDYQRALAEYRRAKGLAALPGGIAAGEELWIIVPAVAGPAAVPADEEAPTQGELRAKVKDATGRTTDVPLPLKHTDVAAEVAAFVATVKVTQQYENPFAVKIEATYVFPLPTDAAVTEFVMKIGERNIRGLIRERKEAERLYREARDGGYVASLLTQERPNIFTQKVANVEPKKRIDVEITYFNTLKYAEGEYEFVFPMVVGPRYNPPGSADGVGAVSRGVPGRSGQATEVQYLKPTERSGHDIAVSVDIDAGVGVSRISSPTHSVDVKRDGTSRATVTLGARDTIPNKDFVLRYRVAEAKLKTALMTTRTDDGGFFALVLQPPESLQYCPRVGREMVFVLDCSGSMNGWPMEKSKEAMRRCLQKLGDNDTFQIIRFSDNASSFGRSPVAATSANIRRAQRFVNKLHGSGGTRMVEGVKAALDFPHDPERFRIVSFMTDGYIGNENEIFDAVRRQRGAARVFSFGVGSSVNRHLIEGMARFGHGAAAFVTLRESSVDAVDRFYDVAGRPALTDVRIDWGSANVTDVYPAGPVDLFVGRPRLIVGRFDGEPPSSIRVVARAGAEDVEYTVAADAGAQEHRGITQVWARRKLRYLADTGVGDPSGALTKQMIDTSITYSVQCKYTAFLAVDSTRITEGNHGVSVAVPVPVPEGVRYDTTVGE